MRHWIGFILLCIAIGMFFGRMATSPGTTVRGPTTSRGEIDLIVVREVRTDLFNGFFLATAVIGAAGLLLLVVPRRHSKPPTPPDRST